MVHHAEKEGDIAARRWKMAASRVNANSDNGDVVDLEYPLYNLTYTLNELNGSNRDYDVVKHILLHQAMEEADLYGGELGKEVYKLLTTRYAMETVVKLNEAIKVKARKRYGW